MMTVRVVPSWSRDELAAVRFKKTAQWGSADGYGRRQRDPSPAQMTSHRDPSNLGYAEWKC